MSWVWYPMLIAGAAVSQLAEFSHLEVAKDWSWYLAYAYAIGFVLVEYLLAVPAERELQKLGKSPTFMYMLFNLTQIITNGIMVLLLFKLPLNFWHYLAYGMLAVCVVFAALGDNKMHEDAKA